MVRALPNIWNNTDEWCGQKGYSQEQNVRLWRYGDKLHCASKHPLGVRYERTVVDGAMFPRFGPSKMELTLPRWQWVTPQSEDKPAGRMFHQATMTYDGRVSRNLAMPGCLRAVFVVVVSSP